MSAVDKIKKLLALASDPGASETERETAGRQAAWLMAKNQLDEYDLMMAEGRDWDLIEVEINGLRPGKKSGTKVPPWIGFIAVGIKEFCGVRVLGHGPRIKFRGPRAQVELATWMQEALVAACYRSSVGVPNPNAYRNGYAGAIQTRLRNMKKAGDSDTPAASGEGHSNSLVVIQDRLAVAMTQRWGPEDSDRSSSCQRGVDGYKAGQNAHIPTNRPMQDMEVKGYLS